MSAAQVLIDTLAETTSYCQGCRTHKRELIDALGEQRRVVRKAAASDRPYWRDQLAVVADRLATEVEHAETHLIQPHVAPAAKLGLAKVARPKAEDNRVKCPMCGGLAVPRGENRIGAHQSPWGRSCTRRFIATPKFDLPPVSLAPLRREQR